MAAISAPIGDHSIGSNRDDRPGRTGRVRPSLRRPRSRMSWAWLGVVPVLPLRAALPDPADARSRRRRVPDARRVFTLDNIARLNQPTIVSAYLISIQVSLASALLGAHRRLLLAYAVVLGRVPQRAPSDRDHLQRRRVEFRRHPARLRLPRHARPDRARDGDARPDMPASTSAPLGFNVLSFWGLTITYLYFQIPLMILILHAGARRAEEGVAGGGG